MKESELTDMEVNSLNNFIDAGAFKNAFISGANTLCNNKELLNDLNVFPVPDGDTGSNMSMTILAAVRELESSNAATVSDVAKCISGASLRGARGNSGVILSQLFRGISKALSGKEKADAKDIADAFKEGVNAAYRAVMKPAEGTILSVSRDGADKAVSAAKNSNDVAVVLKATVDEAQKSLDNTPNLLPQLKAAGVVDAGGQGVLFLLRGALHYAETGEIIKLNDVQSMPAAPKKSAAETASGDIEFGYCTEFLINKKNASDDSTPFADSIKTKGDSMVVIDDDGIIKVHIHTNNPGYVIEQALKLGELINIKIDNMRYQHDAISEDKKAEEKPAEPAKKYGFAAVASGDGFVEILKDMEIDRIIEGGQTMNPSTDDIFSAIKDLNAENIIIFPNNKNIIMAAEQVKSLTDKNIIVIPTRSIPECITAKLVFAPELEPAENEVEMTEIIKTVKTGSVTYSVRDFNFEGENVPKGKILGLEGGKITKVGENPTEVIKEVLSQMADSDAEIISVYYGDEVSDEDAAALSDYLSETYSDCDVAVFRGGQPIYYYIVSVE